MLELLQYLTAALGGVAFFCSTALAIYFIRSKSPLGKAFAYMLAGEALAMCVTLVFSLFAYGVYDILCPQAALALRWILFLGAIITSLHLAWCIRKVELNGISKDVRD